MQLEICQHCRFWKQLKEADKKGTCYYNPPMAVALPFVDVLANKGGIRPVNVRPMTDAHDFCHGFKPMLEIM